MYAKVLGVNTENEFYRDLRKCLYGIDGTGNLCKDRIKIKLGNTDSDVYDALFQEMYDIICHDDGKKIDKNRLLNILQGKDNSNNYNTRILSNYKEVVNRCEEKFCKDKKECQDNIIKFIKFLLGKTGNDATSGVIFAKMCVLSKNRSKAYNIFESINSKGKRLEEIDLIKNYIFAQISTNEDQKKYSAIWGELIKDTKDKLQEYMDIYFKAYIKYSNKIDYGIFKNLIDTDLFPGLEATEDKCKALLDDMKEKVKYFTFLSLPPQKIYDDSQFGYYFYLFQKLHFEFPKPIFLYLITLLKNGVVDKDVFKTLVIEIVKVCTIYTILGKDRKTQNSIFIELFEYTKKLKNKKEKRLDENEFIYSLHKKLKRYITDYDSIEKSIADNNYYEKKELTRAILSYYDGVFSANREKSWIDVYNNFLKDRIQLDHIMKQNPRADSEFPYHAVNGRLKLDLKEGDERPGEIYDGMPYDEFEKKVLGRIGNLRLKPEDTNKSDSNKFLDDDFFTFKELDDRSKKIAKEFVKNVLQLREPSKNVSDEFVNSNPSHIQGEYDLENLYNNISHIK